MSLTTAMETMSVRSSTGGGGDCLMCKERCTGYLPHSWRKWCVACGCSAIDHAFSSDMEDDLRMGRLLADSPCSHMTAKVKGGGGLRLYKRNRMIVTNSVLSGKDPTFSTTTYDWAPPGLTQNLAMHYMDLLPVDRRPVTGTEGSLYRHQQILKQLPVYDQDPMQCCSLNTEEEISSMLLFVRSYKQEVLGLGEVALPGEGGALREAASQRRAKEARDHGNTNSKGGVKHKDLSPTSSSTAACAGSTNGTQDGTKTKLCTGCHGEVAKDSPAVYAERAGYDSALWHPGCFLCSECGQGLVDLVYFWASQKLFCGRHYCQTVWPRCAGCDELIFCQSYHSGTDGQTWHHDHYCCWLCGQSLDASCSCQR